MAKIIRLTESDLTRIIRRVIMEQDINAVANSGVMQNLANSVGGAVGSLGGVLSPQSKTPPSKYPPAKRTPPKKYTAPKACPAQTGKAFQIFKGSNINLYGENQNPATEQPIMPQICINKIVDLKTHFAEVEVDYNIARMYKNEPGFVLTTNAKDASRKDVVLYFGCGDGILRNESLKSLVSISNNVAQAFGAAPANPGVEGLTQVNVIKALKTLCSTNPQNNTVPKVQNKAFAQTGQRQSGNV